MEFYPLYFIFVDKGEDLRGQVSRVEVARGEVSREEASREEAWRGGFEGRITIPPLLFALSFVSAFVVSAFVVSPFVVSPFGVFSFIFSPLVIRRGFKG